MLSLPVILFNVITVLHASFGAESDRIIDYPYFAALPGRCGAAIIAESWVVTAAHCVDPMPANLIWVAGESNESSQFYEFDEVVIHPQYNKYMSVPVNDIALLLLSRPLTFSSTVQAVALPEMDYELNAVHTFIEKGQDVTDHMTRNLMTMNVHTLDEKECISNVHPLLRIFLYPHLDKIRKVTVCTERIQDMQGVCYGDSGSPLVRDNTLVGIASFISDTSCSKAKLALFTNVAPFVNWIKDVTGIGTLEVEPEEP